MAEQKRRRTGNGSTFGSMAYKLDYYGDVVAAPMPEYAPSRPLTRPEPKAAPKAAPQVKPRVHQRTRVRVQVRDQQAVAPFAICGFVAAIAIAVVLLLGHTQLNSVYAETMALQNQLTTLQNECSDLEARYEEVFDMATLESAVAEHGGLRTPAANQSVYIDLSEPDNAVVYDQNEGATGFVQAVRSLISNLVEYFS